MEDPSWLTDIRAKWTDKSSKIQDKKEFENACASCIKTMWELEKKFPNDPEQAYTRVVLFASNTPEEVDNYLKLTSKETRRTFAKRLCPQSQVFYRW